MATIKIYGASDDLIEVEGDVPGCDEFNADAGFVQVSTGDLFSVEYTEAGVWEVQWITPKKGTSLSMHFEPHGEGDDPEPYTDTATVTGNIEWVDFWEHWPPGIEDKKEKVDRFFEQTDDIPADVYDRLYEVIVGWQRRTARTSKGE